MKGIQGKKCAGTTCGQRGQGTTVPSRDTGWQRFPGVVLSVAGDFNPDRLVPKLEAFLLKALAKDPIKRYQNAGEMSAALRDLICSLDPENPKA